LTGVPLPVTDAVIGHDGHMYFTAGGRGGKSNPHPTVNPGTGREIATIFQCGAEQVDAAVAAARAAQPGWWKLGGHGRARYLYALARHVQKHSRLLAKLG